MNPNPAFKWKSRDAMLDFVADYSFSHLFAPTSQGPMMVHVPTLLVDNNQLWFHLSRSNRLVKHLEGQSVLASFGGPGAYISPDWYVNSKQVPTWNYVAVEVSGSVRKLDEQELRLQIEKLTEVHERRLEPKPVWRIDKLDPESLIKLVSSIVGFSIKIDDVRGTAKLSQNKSEADIERVIEALENIGKTHPAALARQALAARRKRKQAQ